MQWTAVQIHIKDPAVFFYRLACHIALFLLVLEFLPCDIICHLALCRRQHNVRRTQLCAHRSQLAVSVDYFLERWYLICSNDRVTVIVQTVTWSITASKRVLVHQCRHAFGFCIHQACVTDVEGLIVGTFFSNFVIKAALLVIQEQLLTSVSLSVIERKTCANYISRFLL